MLKRGIALLLILLALGTALAENNIETGEGTAMGIKIDIQADEAVLTATLADNSSAEAFAALLANGPLTVAMHDYGGFEKVGPLPEKLPTNDERITTTPGDIILYLGDSITIYYDVNTWNFTLLGHIDDVEPEMLREFLGDGDPEITFSLHEETPEEA